MPRRHTSRSIAPSGRSLALRRRAISTLAAAALLGSTVGFVPVASVRTVLAAGTTYVATTGSTGDGTSCDSPGYVGTDQTPIQAAVDAAYSTIVLCDGTYLLTASISVANPAIFVGESASGTIVDGGGAVRLFAAPTTDLTFRTVTLTRGKASGDGGAILAGAVTIRDAILGANVASGDGGAVFATGAVTSRGSRYDDNSAGTGSGGAIFAANQALSSDRDSFRGNTADDGGGAVLGGTVTITGSTFEANAVNPATGTGGAVQVGGSSSFTNSTFVANTAASGGAISTGAYGSAVTNATFAGNSATNGGNIYFNGAGTVSDSVFDGGSCAGVSTPSWSRVTLATDATCTDGSPVTSADLALGTLGDNGGPTETIAITDGSAAYTAGQPGPCPTATDQRGVARAGRGSLCDVGAYTIATFGVAYLVGTPPLPDPCVQFTTIQQAVDLAEAGDVIHICDGFYDIQAEDTIQVDKDLTFEGDSTAGTVIDGGDSKRLFNAPGRSVTFRSLTLTNGSSSGGGGAVSALNVTIVGVDLTSNTAVGAGGAIEASGSVDSAFGTYEDNAAGTLGGAVYADAVTSRSDRFRRNYSPYAGGGAYANTTLDSTSATYEDNTAGTSNGSGGAVFTGLSVSSRFDTFRRNGANRCGGAIYTVFMDSSSGTYEDNTVATAGGFCPGLGGAIYAAYVDSLQDGFARNVSPGDGGAIYSGSDVDLTSSTFVGNSAGGSGGAVKTQGYATSTSSAYRDNTATTGYGGAIYTHRSITTTHDSFLRNTSTYYGGAIYAEDTAASAGGVYEDNTAATIDGGAIYAADGVTSRFDQFRRNRAGNYGGAVFTQGPVESTAGTYEDNTAVAYYGGAIFASGTVGSDRDRFLRNLAGVSGGAIYADGDVDISAGSFEENTAATATGGAVYTLGHAEVDGSTFARNRAIAGDGGGIGAVGGVRATNSTFYANETAGYGGAIVTGVLVDVLHVTFRDNTSGIGDHVSTATTLDSVRSIFAGGDCLGSGTDTDNVTTDASCPGGASPVTEAALDFGPFANFGGPTKTQKIRSGSAALDVATPDCPTTVDQRGAARPQGSGCDAGAFELTATVVTYTGPNILFVGTATSARATLTGTTYPALAGCDLRFSLTSSGGTAYGPYDASTGLKGSGSVITALLPVDTYSVVVSPLADCGGAPDGSGVLAIVPDNVGKGTAGGGSYKVGGFTGPVKFAHVVQVKSTTSKVGRTSVTTVTTKGSLIWTYKNVWRVKARIDYASTDGTSSTWGTFACPASLTTGTVCGRFSGAALLQTWSEGTLTWVGSDYANVTFVVTVYDGGTKSTCTKNKCSTTAYPDWFGIEVRSSGVPLTTANGLPVSIPIQMVGSGGNGSLKAY